MSHVTLRILAMNSKMKFGKFFDYTVKECLFIKNQYGYIAWCYYNLSNISFSDEILDLVGIEHRIEKPGNDVAFFEENKELIDSTAFQKCIETGDMRNKYKGDKLKRKLKNDSEMIFMRSFESRYSKGALQRINHKK